MFEIYKKNVEITDANGSKDVYTLRPLSGRFLPKLYRVIKKMSPDDGKEFSVKDLDEEVLGDLHEIALETFKKSYPAQEVDVLDQWVAQNLMLLIEPLLEVNLGKPDESRK